MLDYKKFAIYYEKPLNFVAEYYSDICKANLTWRFDFYASTSCIIFLGEIDAHTGEKKGTINISLSQISSVIEEIDSSSLKFPLVYTMIMHEIAHAIYSPKITSRQVDYNIINILEDMRIERQVSRWNKRARFELIRYLLQDKVITTKIAGMGKHNLLLALVRTINNAKYVHHFGKTKEQKEAIKEILRLANEYADCQTKFELDFELESDGENDFNKTLIPKVIEIEKLLDKILLSAKKDNAESESDYEEQNMPSEQEKQTLKEKINGISNGILSDLEKEQLNKLLEELPKMDSSALEEANEFLDKISEEKKLEEEIKTDLLSIEFEGAKMIKEIIKIREICKNFNPQKDVEKYNRIPIPVFTSLRRKGIKGFADDEAISGNIKQLSLKRYARRNYVKNEKLFDKTSEIFQGGKTNNVIFYIDISGSMRYPDIKKLETTINYVKSFYDSLHKYLNIKIYAFNSSTYELNRDALNFEFIKALCCGSTKPDLIQLSPEEEIIIITDGEWDVEIPDFYKEKAHFVLIDIERGAMKYFEDIKNKYFVDTDNIQAGLNKATKGIKKLLGC